MIMFLVVGGLVATYVVKNLIAHEEKAPQIASRLVPLPIAEIAPGTMVTEAHLGEGRIRESQLEPDMLISNRVIVGRIAKEKLTSRSPIKAGQLYPPGETPPLKLEDGMRAITAEISGMAGIVGGNVRAGNYVDVHFSPSQIPYATDQATNGLTMTLFKGVKILAIRGQSQTAQNHTVTFELTPMQANILELSKQKGILTLAYNPQGKGNGELAVKSKDRVMLNEILGISPPKVEVPTPPFTTQLFRGQGRQQNQFAPNNKFLDTQSVTPSTGTNAAPAGAGATNQAPPQPAAPAQSQTAGQTPTTPNVGQQPVNNISPVVPPDVLQHNSPSI